MKKYLVSFVFDGVYEPGCEMHNTKEEAIKSVYAGKFKVTEVEIISEEIYITKATTTKTTEKIS